MKAWYIGAALVTLAVLACHPTAAHRPSSIDTARIVAADREPQNWLTHGRTYDEQRFSPLEQLTPQTVGRLGLTWSYELKTPRGASATPIVVDGVMYVTSAWSLVYALDARTGGELWVYDPRASREAGATACCDVVNRGVAAYGGKIFVGVVDGRLVALDARTGKVVWETLTVDRTKPYTITGAPRAANGLVYIGNGGAEFGVRGYVSAYDTETGALRWRFYTVPGDPERGPDGAASDPMMAKAAATWTGQWWTLGGGGTVWDAIVYDPDFDQVIVGVGNGSPWNQKLRSPGGGDNLFLTCILALDARTGAYRWHYQTVPGDTWDYTATQPIMLAELTIDGRRRKVAMQAPKNGFFYVVDRETGELISAAPLLPVFTTANTPAGAPLSWAHRIDLATGRPVENPGARYADKPALVRPGPLGVHNWHPMSFDPEHGLVHIPVQDMAFGYEHATDFVARPAVLNTGTVITDLPSDVEARATIKASSKGFLLAWDPVKGEAVWRIEHKGPWNGGTLATAGGLVFQGTVDGRFVAFDARTGRLLWSYATDIATLAGPIAYAVGGEQHVVVLSGYGGAFFLGFNALAPVAGTPVNGRVYAFKLGGTATKKPVMAPKAAAVQPPKISASEADIQKGAALYAQFCLRCHGVTAAGGAIADLRKSPLLGDPAAWARYILGQEVLALGMPRFDKELSATDVERIRAYVASEAARTRTREEPTAPSGSPGL